MSQLGQSAREYLTRERLGEWLRKYAIVVILIGMIVLLAVLTGGRFLEPQNLINVVRQVSRDRDPGASADGRASSRPGSTSRSGRSSALSAVVADEPRPAARCDEPDVSRASVAAGLRRRSLAGLLVGAAAGFTNGVPDRGVPDRAVHRDPRA